MNSSGEAKKALLIVAASLCAVALWPGPVGASSLRRLTKAAVKRAAHHRDTVMYYVTGDARSADVSYMDAQGMTVHLGWVQFPWKIYLHPKRGAQLFVSASVAGAEPGATVGVWVNGRVVSGSASDGNPRGYAAARATLDGADPKMRYFKGDEVTETTHYFGQFPLVP